MMSDNMRENEDSLLSETEDTVLADTEQKTVPINLSLMTLLSKMNNNMEVMSESLERLHQRETRPLSKAESANKRRISVSEDSDQANFKQRSAVGPCKETKDRCSRSGRSTGLQWTSECS